MKSITNFFKRTTKSEWGFYIYGMGSLQFAVLVFGVVTVVLEATAAESSTQADGITACDTSIKNYKCWIDIFGWAISPTTYSLYVLTVGHLLQAFSLIQFSGLSDHGNLRSIYLIFFTVLGGIGSATIVFAVNKSGWYWVAISYIFISFAYSLATAIHSSYIPILADIELDLSRSEDKKGLLEGESELIAMERSRGRLSDIGLMSGLFLGTIASLISAIISFQFNGSNTSLIYTLFVSSLFWLVLGIIGWYILENKPGPPIKNPLHYVTLSWNKLGLTLSSARSYSNILILFMGWFMLLDSVSMLFILLKLIGKVQVGMTAADFLLMACLTSPLEVLGMIFYNFIQKRFNLNCKQMIILHLVFYLIFPIYYFIGTFLNFGFDSKAEVYILKLVLIFPYSHLSSVQRVLLSNFIPAGRETEFFSLNQVFGRGTAWIGPLLVGSVESFTGNIRYGFIFPIAFMLVGLIFLLQINVEKGLDQAKENSLSGAVYEMLEVDS